MPSQRAIRVRDDTESSSRENGVRAVASTPYAWAGFALSGNGRDLAIIDLRSRVRVKTIHLRDVADRPYATQDGAFMIIPSSAEKSVTLVSLETMAEVARLPGAADVTDVRTGYLDTLAFVVSRGENKVVVIDLVERRTIGDIPLPGRPELAVTSPDGSKLYVALVDVSKLAVIEVIHRRLLNVIASGVQAPWGGFTAGSLAYCH